MMKPIYFPFTYLPQPIWTGLNGCFRTIRVLQPSGFGIPEEMRKWEKMGSLEIDLPDGDDEDHLEKVFKAYQRWAMLHQKSGMTLLNAFRDKIPFFYDTSSSQILKDIKKKDHKGRKGRPGAFFSDRLFLMFAQEFDTNYWEASRHVQSVIKMEQDLMKNLKGENGDDDVQPKGDSGMLFDDASNYMAMERMESWARLLFRIMSCGDKKMPALFITSSRLAYESLMGKFPEAENISDLQSIPSGENKDEKIEKWRQSLMASLERLAKSRWPQAEKFTLGHPGQKRGAQEMSLTLDIIPKIRPHDFVSHFYQTYMDGGSETRPGDGFNHTLIGYVSLNPQRHPPPPNF